MYCCCRYESFTHVCRLGLRNSHMLFISWHFSIFSSSHDDNIEAKGLGEPFVNFIWFFIPFILKSGTFWLFCWVEVLLLILSFDVDFYLSNFHCFTVSLTNLYDQLCRVHLVLRTIFQFLPEPGHLRCWAQRPMLAILHPHHDPLPIIQSPRRCHV